MLYRFAKGLLKPFFMFFYGVRMEGIENIPAAGPYILCANHKNAIDPVIIGTSLPIKRMHFIAKAELFKNKFFGFVLRNLGAFPVKRGEVDLGSIKTSLKILGESKVLAIFPEGTRNKSEDVKAEPGIAMLAIRSKCPIVPVSLKSNYKFFNKTILYIGKPFTLEQYYDMKLKNEDYIKISHDIMTIIKEKTKG